jgi:hypothetical protein
MKNTYLFLDDIRNPIEAYSYTNYTSFISNEWHIVRTYDEFTQYIINNDLPDFISFDHDLGEISYSTFWYDDTVIEEKTGFDCAKFLIEYCIDNNKDLPDYYVHSMNPVGKKNILSLLSNYSKFRNAS